MPRCRDAGHILRLFAMATFALTGLVQAAGADGYAPPERAPRLLKKLEDVCAYAGVAVCAGCQESDGPT